MEFIFVYLVLVNTVTFLLYLHDKQCAYRGKWRVSESVLLSFAFGGGGLGAFMAMHMFHHKTKHSKFQIYISLFLFFQILLLIINL